MTDASFGSAPGAEAQPRRVWSVSSSAADFPMAASGPSRAASAPLTGAPAASSAPPMGAPVTAPPPSGGSHAAPPPVGATPLSAPPVSAPPVNAPPVMAPPPSAAPLDGPPPQPMGAPVQVLDEAGLPGVVMPGIHPALVHALDDLVARGGSDLHIAAGAPPLVRVDGELRPVTDAQPWSPEEVHQILASAMTDRQAVTFTKEWELDFAISPRGDNRFRVNYYHDRGAMAAAFRLIPTEIKTLKQLGVPSVVSKFATLPRGLVLVTGPTGSGKSTTLAALIDLVNRSRADHIVTVEDPIEFVHRNHRSLVNQREVGADTHSFADALKRVLRQDPDVILIGELRDLETVSTALTAAETGHLVFATLHTQSAAQTIDRIIDVFPPHQQGQVRSQLALTLQGVVCQTLLPRASGGGRVIATEIMMTTGAIANLIREGKTYQITSALQAGREQGMHTMDQHLADLVNSGIATYEAAMAKMQDAENFNRLVNRGASPGGGGGFGA